MGWNNCKIFCVYPEDKSTKFLNRIVTYLKRNLDNDFHCFKVKLNEQSHNECLEKLNILENKIIIFLGHGRSDYLFGACGPKADSYFVDPLAVEEIPEYFRKENFINKDNCSVFNNNIVFSLSCNSNKLKNSIGTFSIMNGAKTYIGFGDIPTDNDDDNIELTEREISIFKGIITRIVKKSLLYSWKNNYTVEQLVDVIKLLTNKEAFNLIVKNKGIKYRYRIAKYLYWFKKEIEILGQKNIKLNQQQS